MFKSFNNQKSLVTYIALSSPCIIYNIDAKDLSNLANDLVNLAKKLNVIKIKLKNKLLTDIDFKTFPRRYLQSELEKSTQKDFDYLRKNIKQ